MLIKALCEYADRLAEKSSDRPPKGWGWQDVSFRIMLSPDGRVTNIIDIREEKSETDKKGKVKKKKIPLKIQLPERTQKTAIDSNSIEHRPLYIFGLELGKEGFSASSKASKSHAAFVKHELELFEGLDSEMCTAYRNFLEAWQPENETENPLLKDLGSDYKGSYFAFGLEGGKQTLETDEQFRKRYDELFAEQRSSGDTEGDSEGIMQCGITGDISPAARIHDKIKFPGGLSSGCVLVGMKEPAFESYGKTQSFNSGISETAMKKYTSTFNYLLSDRKHRIMVGGMVVVFFAIKSNDNDDSAECDLFADFFGDNRAAVENRIEDGLSGALKTVANGAVGDTEAVIKLSTDENAVFYVAGLSANSSRICQKFIYRSRFGDIEANLKRHTEGLKMCGNKKPVSFYALEQQLKPPKSKDYVVPPPLMTGVILAALKGTKYPDALLQGMIRRVLTDSDGENDHFTKLNDIRAGAIKACINRKYGKEELTVALDVNNSNEAYLCGRLFAVLEKIQQDASEGTLNRTITDAYFSSAASKPSSVLPKLIQLSMNHQRKLSDQSVIFYNKLIGGIIDGLDGEFPHTLDLDGQGRFIVGYYQQKQAFYTKKTEDGKEG